jgi:hypothetical protein
MEFEELLAPVAGEFDVEEALATWRWLVPEHVRPLVLTACGDLFLIAEDGSVLFLDTIGGKCQRIATSKKEWEKKLKDSQLLEEWFMPRFVSQLREAGSILSQGECYSATIPPVLSGKYTVENWPPTHWRVHFHSLGQIQQQVKDLPAGTPITKIHFTKI